MQVDSGRTGCGCHGAAHVFYSLQCCRNIITLPGDLRKIEPGTVVHADVIGLLVKQALKDAVGFVSQAIRQVEATQHEFGLCCMVRQALLLPGNLQPHNAVEVVLLEIMVEHLAVLQIPDR